MFNQREEEMGTYLTSLACDRPAEGQIIKTAFEHFDKELSIVRESLARLRSQGAAGSSLPANGPAMFEVRSGPVGSGCSPLERIELDNVKDRVALLATQMESLASQRQSTEQRLSNVQLQASAATFVPASLMPPAPGFCGTCGDGSAGMTGELAAIWTKIGVICDGNPTGGSCHCHHVSQLNTRVEIIERDYLRRADTPARTRSIPAGGVSGAYGVPAEEAGRAETPESFDSSFPLARRGIGVLGNEKP